MLCNFLLCLISYNSPVIVLSVIRVWLFATPWTATHQASLFFTISRSLLKLMSIESVMPSNHLILCCPLFLLPSIFPSIKVFSNESAFHIRWLPHKRMKEDETVGWYHKPDGHEFEQAPEVGDGQGSLVCCSPWGCKELDTTEWLNRIETLWHHSRQVGIFLSFSLLFT